MDFDDDDGCAECHSTESLCPDGFCEACHAQQCEGKDFDHSGGGDAA